MELWLVDINPDMVAAWKEHFSGIMGVQIVEGNILDVAENTIVSPSNSYGLMDGGIDAAYTEFFGLSLQLDVQDLISMRPERILPVGSAVFVETGNDRIPYMICAPTMRDPGPVSFVNCFFAMSAVLKLASRNDVVQKVFCPGLGTGTGRVDPDLAAKEMAAAYKKWAL
ncbi:hypothetical protein D1BOALGB6SA_10338 [Olavius sp. associated proteobacterium Delta 1]|nr:hypothetical protein D1BOALGB6SA_10338 [Olavius sp. associated proteobacterium Delta 1]